MKKITLCMFWILCTASMAPANEVKSHMKEMKASLKCLDGSAMIKAMCGPDMNEAANMLKEVNIVEPMVKAYAPPAATPQVALYFQHLRETLGALMDAVNKGDAEGKRRALTQIKAIESEAHDRYQAD